MATGTDGYDYPAVSDADNEVVQVLMTAAFYNNHFLPLLQKQDFRLMEWPLEDEEHIRTLGITFGPIREASFRERSGL